MEIPRHWRLKDQRYRLIGLKNKVTGKVEFPPKANKIIFSSKLSSYTLDSYMVIQEKQLQTQEQ